MAKLQTSVLLPQAKDNDERVIFCVTRKISLYEGRKNVFDIGTDAGTGHCQSLMHKFDRLLNGDAFQSH